MNEEGIVPWKEEDGDDNELLFCAMWKEGLISEGEGSAKEEQKLTGTKCSKYYK